MERSGRIWRKKNIRNINRFKNPRITTGKKDLSDGHKLHHISRADSRAINWPCRKKSRRYWDNVVKKPRVGLRPSAFALSPLTALSGRKAKLSSRFT